MPRLLPGLALLGLAAGAGEPSCAEAAAGACAPRSAGSALVQRRAEVSRGELGAGGAGQDFTIVIIPDTQFMVMNNGYAGAWQHEWIAQADWVVAKQHELNIAAVIHVGDVVEEAHRSWEWDNFFEGWDKIEATGIPWSVVPGNHDLTSMRQPFAANRWDDYNRYMTPVFGRNPHLHGSFPPGKYENSVVFFEASGIEFMVVGIELGPVQASLDWASGQLNQHPHKRAIINNHFVPWGSERGIDIVGWAKRHRNVFMIHQGHDCAREWNRVHYNNWGEPVQEVLTDYQCSGDAFLRYYTFHVQENRVAAFTYSPSLRRFETDRNSQWSFDFPMRDQSSSPSPSPPTPISVTENYYREEAGVGGFGGWCTCPDGQRYNVGDKWDECANGPDSLACEGGTPGECVRVEDHTRFGMKVTCAAAESPSPQPQQPSPQPTPPAPQPSPPVPSPAAENQYRRVDGVGGWGGWCTCPDGQRYNVGDNGDSCGSLACEGGTPGHCNQWDEADRKGMKVTCAESGLQPMPSPPISDPPSPSPSPAGNNYRRVNGVGGWGGWCTCPDGQRYNVGDKQDGCGSGPSSLACEGGTPGECVQHHDDAREGMKVTCAAAEPGTPPSCAPFPEWPGVDGGVTCNDCMALVRTSPHNTCSAYCQSFGHVCAAAAEEVNEDCQVKYTARCDQPITGTSDMLCTCRLPAA